MKTLQANEIDGNIYSFSDIISLGVSDINYDSSIYKRYYDKKAKNYYYIKLGKILLCYDANKEALESCDIEYLKNSHKKELVRVNAVLKMGIMVAKGKNIY